MKIQYCKNIIGDKINRNFPDRRPVIAERHPDSEIRLANCRKYLLPFNLTLGQFYFLLRKKMGMKSDEALFLFVKVHMFTIMRYLQIT